MVLECLYTRFMTRLILIFLCVVAMSPQNTHSQAKVDFKIKGLAGGWCYVSGVFGEQTYVLDSIKADANGAMTFESDTSLGGGVYYVFMPDRRTVIQMVMGKSPYKINFLYRLIITKLMKISPDF